MQINVIERTQQIELQEQVSLIIMINSFCYFILLHVIIEFSCYLQTSFAKYTIAKVMLKMASLFHVINNDQPTPLCYFSQIFTLSLGNHFGQPSTFRYFWYYLGFVQLKATSCFKSVIYT